MFGGMQWKAARLLLLASRSSLRRSQCHWRAWSWPLNCGRRCCKCLLSYRDVWTISKSSAIQKFSLSQAMLCSNTWFGVTMFLALSEKCCQVALPTDKMISLMHKDLELISCGANFQVPFLFFSSCSSFLSSLVLGHSSTSTSASDPGSSMPMECSNTIFVQYNSPWWKSIDSKKENHLINLMRGPFLVKESRQWRDWNSSWLAAKPAGSACLLSWAIKCWYLCQASQVQSFDARKSSSLAFFLKNHAELPNGP